jgi:hypothetical protein
MAKTGTRNYSTRGTQGGMTCRHSPTLRWRVKAGPWFKPANKPGPASCGLCHPPAAPLVERGMVEFADGRPTPEPDPPSPNEPGVILRCTGLERIAPPVPKPAPKLVVPTPSEAKGPVIPPEQAVSGPVGPQRHNPPRGPVKTAASARKTKKSPPPPPAPSLF